MFPSSSLQVKPGGAVRTRGALASIQPPISGRKSPKTHHSHVPAAQTDVFAQVNLSARVIRQRTVQRRSPAGEARLPQGAGSTTVTVMLFNTGIPLASSGINALSSQSVLFAWEGGASGRGPRKIRDSRQITGRWPGTFDSACCCVGRFLCWSNNSLETGKIREARNKDLKPQETPRLPPVRQV